MAHPDNAFYGHNRLLAAYDGRTDTPIIRGQVQHGWNNTTGIVMARHRVVRDLPKFVWSTNNLRRCREAGLGPATAIGAPFAYLAKARGASPAPPPGSVIAYPAHSVPRERIHADHATMAADLSSMDAPIVTVCLYWYDHGQPAIRRLYEDAGLEVISHGHRSDPAFLERQHRALVAHEVLVTNRAASAMFYGILLGLRPRLLGPVFAHGDASEADTFERYQRAAFPELYDAGATATDLMALANRELGVDHLREPGELAEVLGWVGAPGRDAAYWLRTRSAHYARAVGHRIGIRGRAA